MANQRLLPLVLSVKCENWRMDDHNSGDADAEFSRVRKKALDRDNQSCRFCGFRHTKWQEVHHANDDHADNRLENLITTCTFCHLVQHIGFAGKNEEAVLVWLPEISQNDLHHIVRTILVAERAGENTKSRAGLNMGANQARTYKEVSDVAKATMASLLERSGDAEKRLGTCDPLELGNAMRLLPDEIYAKRAEFLSGIRLLPLGKRMVGSEDVMRDQISSWMDAGGPYSRLQPNTWSGLMKSILS